MFLSSLIVITVDLIVHNAAIQKTIENKVNELIESQSLTNISFHKVKFSLFPLKIDIYGLKVISAADDDVFLAKIDHVSMHLALSTIYTGKIKFSWIDINKLSIDPANISKILSKLVIANKKNKTSSSYQPLSSSFSSSQFISYNPNLIAKFQAKLKSTRSSFYMIDFNDFIDKLTIDKAIVDNSKINLSDYFPGFKNNNILLGAKSFDFQLNSGNSPKFTGTLVINDLNLQHLNNTTIDQAMMELSFSFDDQMLKLDDIYIKDGKNIFSSDVQLSFADLKSFIPTYVTFDSSLAFDLGLLKTVKGFDNSKGFLKTKIRGWMNPQKSVFAVFGNADYQDSILGGYKMFDGRFNYRVTSNQIVLDKLEVFEDNKLLAHANGVITLSKDLNFRFNLFPNNLSISKIYNVINLSNPTLEGELSKDPISIYGKINPFIIYVKSQTVFSNFRIINFYRKHQNNLAKIDFGVDCKFSIFWIINSQSFDFNDSQGKCADSFDPTADIDNKFQDPVKFSGIVDFTKGLDLEVQLATDNLSLYRNFTYLDLDGSGYHQVKIKGGFKDIRTILLSTIDKFHLNNTYLGDVKSSITYVPRLKKFEIKYLHLDNFDPSTDSASPNLNNYNTRNLSKDNIKKFKDHHQKVGDKNSYYIHQGSYDFTNQKLAFSLNTNHMSLEPLVRMFNIYTPKSNVKLKGYADNIDLKLMVKFSSKPSLTLALNYSLTNLQYPDHKISATKGKLSLNNNQLNLSNASITLFDNFQIDFDVLVTANRSSNNNKTFYYLPVLSKNSDFKLTLNAHHIDHKPINLAKIYFLSKLLSIDSINEQKLTGKINFYGDLYGPINSPQGNINIDYFMLFAEHKSLIASSGKIVFNQGEISGIFGSDDRSLAVKFSHYLDDHKFYLQTNIQRFNLLPYIQLFDNNLQNSLSSSINNYLYVDSKINFSAKLPDVDSFVGSVELSTVQGNFAGFLSNKDISQLDLFLKNPVVVSFSNRGFELDNPIKLLNRAFSLQFTSTKRQSWKEFEFLLEGKISQSKLANDISYIDRAAGDARIFGKLGYRLDTKFDYDISIELLSDQFAWLAISGFNPPLNALSYHINFTKDRIKLVYLKASQGRGQVEIKGDINTEIFYRLSNNFTDSTANNQNNSPINIKLFADDALFSFESDSLGVITGYYRADIVLSGESFPLNLDGKIEILNLNTNKPIKLYDDLIRNLSQDPIKHSVDTVTTKIPLINLNLNITANDSLHIQNYPVNFIIGGNLTITGAPSQPMLSGYLKVADGEVFYKTNYQIIDGGVYFSGTQDIDPLVDISGKSTISGYEVTFRINGPISDPQVEFFVNPSVSNNGVVLSQTDILFLMTNGRLPESDVSWQTRQDVLISEALNVTVFNVLNDRLSSLIQASRQNIIKDVNIQTYSSEKIGGGTQLKAVAPLYIGQENLSVVLEGKAESVGFRAQYELDPNISTSLNYQQPIDQTSEKTDSSLDRRLESSVGLRFRFSFP